jgi:hypothetical protein
LVIETSDFERLDDCARKSTWARTHFPLRIPLTAALYSSLREGLLTGDPDAAKQKMVELAGNPGLDISAQNLYEIAIHHASLVEVLTAYLTAEGKWEPAESVPFGKHEFRPLSFQMPDGRLRRVVLCDRWDNLRKMSEMNGLRTISDVTITGRPMLLNAIVIGQSRFGFRPSSWTQGFIHPINKSVRVKIHTGSKGDTWQKVYREASGIQPMEWLKLMQQDEAIEGLVHHETVDIPLRCMDVREDLCRMARVIESKPLEMRRSACFRFGVCEWAKLCYNEVPTDPEKARWAIRKWS